MTHLKMLKSETKGYQNWLKDTFFFKSLVQQLFLANFTKLHKKYIKILSKRTANVAKNA